MNAAGSPEAVPGARSEIVSQSVPLPLRCREEAEFPSQSAVVVGLGAQQGAAVSSSAAFSRPRQEPTLPLQPEAPDRDWIDGSQRARPAQDALPAWNVRAVGAIAGIAAMLLCLRAGRYGYFGDELYFLSAGRRPAVGYADQGPLVPLLARGIAWIEPESLVALRMPSIVCGIVAIWVCAGIAREFGGGKAAQRLAAVAFATSPFLITSAATLSTFALDAAFSALLVWMLVRWARIREDRLLVWAAVCAVVDLQIKLLLPVLGVGIVLGVLVFGPRAVFRRPALWMAVVVAALTVAPSLRWQARHDWPQLAMGPVIANEQRAATGGVIGLPVQWALLLGVLGSPLVFGGLWFLLRSARGRAYRFVAVMVLVQALFVIITDSRPYYLAGLFPVLLAAGAVWWTEREHRLWRTVIGAMAVVVAVVIAVTVILILPLPASALHEPTNSQQGVSARMRLFGMDGWNELVDDVSAAASELPPEERSQAVVIAQTYWQASALDQLGVDLPPVFSPNRGFAYFGRPPATATTVLYVGSAASESALHRDFRTVQPVAGLDDPLGFPGITRHLVIFRCEHPLRSWSEIWPAWRTTALDSAERTVR